MIRLTFAINLALCASCSGGLDFVQLPDAPGAKAWMLSSDDAESLAFDATQSGSFVPQEASRLSALPQSFADIGLTRRPNVGRGRPIPVLASYALDGGQWREVEPVALASPFDPEICAGRCLATYTCETCFGGTSHQGCGPCTGVEPDPPMPPDPSCPPQWVLLENDDGHRECLMRRPDGIELPCGPRQRWSMPLGVCVDIEQCEAPDVAADAVYVDPAAPAGGDGTSASPFNDFPSNSQASTVVLRPGDYDNEPIVVIKANQRVVGHGLCTHLRGYVHVMAPDVGLESVYIETLGAAVIVDGSAAVRDCKITGGPDGVQAPVGSATISSSLIQWAPGNEDSGAALVLGQVNLHDVDVIGSAQLTGAVEVRDTRFISENNNRGTLQSEGRQLTVANTAVFGTGLFSLADRIGLTDVLIEIQQDSERSGVTVGPGDLELERIDIVGAANGIRINEGNLKGNDVRVKTPGYGVRKDPDEVAGNLELNRAWISSGKQAVQFAGLDLTLVDIHATRMGGETVTSASVIDVAFGTLTLRRASIITNRAGGLLIQSSADVTDYRYRGGGSGISPTVGFVDGRPLVKGQRWDIEAFLFGVRLPGRWELSDIRVRPGAGVMDLVPLEVRGAFDSNFLDRFVLVPSGGRPSIALVDGDEASGWRARVASGRLTAPVIATSESNSYTPLQNVVGLDNVTMVAP